MNKIIYFLLLLLLPSTWVTAQTISGNLSLLTNQTIKLEEFSGFKTYLISYSGVDFIRTTYNCNI